MNETELVFTRILDCDRPSLYLDKKLNLDRERSRLISSVLKRRITGEPLQYILGKTEFMGREFKVNQNVFIPRPETEILVETVIDIACSLVSGGGERPFSAAQIKDRVCSPTACGARCFLRILDIGTGSGCIAVSLAKVFRNAEITAVDISRKALEVARENAVLNKVKIPPRRKPRVLVQEGLHFLQSDLFSNSRLKRNAYDLIVSNPPYIPGREIMKLQAELSFEPLLALDGGGDGLAFYRKMAAQAKNYLKEGGFLVVEIGFNQKDAVERIFEEAGHFKAQEVIKDYSGIDRVMVLQNL